MSFDDERRDRGELSPEARELWRAARRDVIGADGPAPAPDRLAAYLDGRLDAAERAQLEAELALSEAGRTLLVASREALSGGPVAAPAALVARAQGLVRAPARAADEDTNGGFWERLGRHLFPGLRPVGWVGAASLCLLLGVLSFELGALGYRHAAGSAQQAASYELADEGSWQLLDVL